MSPNPDEAPAMTAFNADYVRRQIVGLISDFPNMSPEIFAVYVVDIVNRYQRWTEHRGPTSNQENPTMSPNPDVTLTDTSRVRSDRERPAPAPVAPTRRYRVATGELRSRLQPVVFLTLLEPIENPNGLDFVPGEMVTVQFWGPGNAAVNAAAKPTAVVDDRIIHGYWPTTGTKNEVTTAELRAHLQPVIFGRLEEAASDFSDGSTMEAGEQVAIQFHGGGMTGLTNVRTGELVVARTNGVHIDWDRTG